MHKTIGLFGSRPVIAIESQATVLSALQLMSEKRISSIIALADSEPVGILTERDIVFAANWVLGDPGLLISDVMNKPVLTASESMTVEQAYQVFRQHKIRHLVMLDDRLNMSGIFTQTDLVRSLRDRDFDSFCDISDLMSPQVLNVAPGVSARYALSLMARRSVSCIVVVDNQQPIGIFTERDVVRCIAEGINLTSAAVDSVMSPSVITAPLTTTPRETISLMQDKSVRRLLVLDSKGDMAGIVTQTDIGRVLDHYELSLNQTAPRPTTSQSDSAPAYS